MVDIKYNMGIYKSLKMIIGAETEKSRNVKILS